MMTSPKTPEPPSLTRIDLRRLVDHVWQTAYEDESVPATAFADRMIDHALASRAEPPVSTPSLQRNAARYLFLRDWMFGLDKVMLRKSSDGPEWRKGDDLDQSVDAAMAADRAALVNLGLVTEPPVLEVQGEPSPLPVDLTERSGEAVQRAVGDEAIRDSILRAVGASRLQRVAHEMGLVVPYMACVRICESAGWTPPPPAASGNPATARSDEQMNGEAK